MHPADDRNFGNAILSPWPIEDDAKLVLPHPGRFRKMQRIAVAATVRVWGELPVRVFSVHLETPVGLGPGAKRDQARAVVESAAGYPRVLVAGDFNGHGFIEKVFPPAGFLWLTRERRGTRSRASPGTTSSPAGCGPPAAPASGTVPNDLKVSDHLPVWAELVPE